MRFSTNKRRGNKFGGFRIPSWLACGLLGATLLGVPCAPSFAQVNRSKDDAKKYQALANVPEKARAKQNPLAEGASATAAGGKLFQEHCAECHGMKAEGGKYGASLLRPEVSEATPGALFWVLSNGVVWRGMPDWSKLPEAQRWQLVAFMKSLSPANHGPTGAAE